MISVDLRRFIFAVILQEEVAEVLKLQYWMSYASETQFSLSVWQCWEQCELFKQ